MAEIELHVCLFRDGPNQTLCIPLEFELEGDEASLRKEGGRLIVEPVRICWCGLARQPAHPPDWSVIPIFGRRPSLSH